MGFFSVAKIQQNRLINIDLQQNNENNCKNVKKLAFIINNNN